MRLLNQTLSCFSIVAFFLTLPASAADILAGEQKAMACIACHGQKGISGNIQWPNLAAQQPVYLVNQLKAFKTGNRSNPIMQALAANLSTEDTDNLAAYFSSQKPAKMTSDSTLAKSGEASSSMCLGCHGMAAEGKGQFPRLAGQSPEYLEQQLKNFKAGSRKSGPMQAITANLTEAEMKALAAYLGSL